MTEDNAADRAMQVLADAMGYTARCRAWEQANPERAAVHSAKRALRGQTGIAMRDVPNSVAEAKALELEIRRWARSTPPPETKP